MTPALVGGPGTEAVAVSIDGSLTFWLQGWWRGYDLQAGTLPWWGGWGGPVGRVRGALVRQTTVAGEKRKSASSPQKQTQILVVEGVR